MQNKAMSVLPSEDAELTGAEFLATRNLPGGFAARERAARKKEVG
jgi:hypothetical protein